MNPINPNTWYYWLLILITFRIPITYYQINIRKLVPVEVCSAKTSLEGLSKHGDTVDYLCPVENLLSKGEWKVSYHKTEFLRLPGYSLIYLIFRLFLTIKYAIIILIVFQNILGSIASYLLSLSAYLISGRRLIFVLVLVFYGMNIYVVFHEVNLLSESTSASFIAISIYFFVKYMQNKCNKYLLYSGIFLGWSAFTRPAHVFAFPLYLLALSILSIHRNNKLTKLIREIAILLTPYSILMLCFYTIYYAYNNRIYKPTFHPHNNHPYVKKVYTIHGILCGPNLEINLYPVNGKKCDYSFFTYGVFLDLIIEREDNFYLARSGDISLYGDCFIEKNADPIKIYLSKCTLSSKVSIDTLLSIIEILQKIKDVKGKEFYNLVAIADSKLGSYIESVKKEKPIYYYLTSRLKAFMLLITSGQAHFRGHSALPQIPWFPILLLFHTLPLWAYLVLLPISTFLLIINRKYDLLSLILLTISGISIVLSYIFLIDSLLVKYLSSAYPYIFWGLGIQIACISECSLRKSISNI